MRAKPGNLGWRGERLAERSTIAGGGDFPFHPTTNGYWFGCIPPQS